MHAFDEISRSLYAFWLSSKMISVLSIYISIECFIGSVRVGLQTGADGRFLRMLWEVPVNTIGALLTAESLSSKVFTAALGSTFRIGKRWAFCSKTDYASPWLSPIILVVDWLDDGVILKDHIRARGYSPS